MSSPLLCYPLDFPNAELALQGAAKVGDAVDVLKIGLELFVEAGPAVVRDVARLGKPIFLDLKLHDIPETVHRAVKRACDLGVRYLTLHAGGGPRMLGAGVEAVAQTGAPLTLLGVTVLTSLDANELTALGIPRSPAEHALHLAGLGAAAGLRGFVCSPHEVKALRQKLGHDAVLVTPGVRPAGADAGDQMRVATPAATVLAGSSMLVVGRPIRDAKNPAEAAAAIRQEMLTASATSAQQGRS